MTIPQPIGSTIIHITKPELTERQEVIIKVLKEHGSVTISELGEKLGIEVPERTLRDELNRLKNLELVSVTGQTTTRKWKAL